MRVVHHPRNNTSESDTESLVNERKGMSKAGEDEGEVEETAAHTITVSTFRLGCGASTPLACHRRAAEVCPPIPPRRI